MQLPESEGHVASLRYLSRIVTGLRDIGEDLPHLVLRLEIELIIGKPHPVLFIYGSPRLDAHQHILSLRIFLPHIVNVVGGDEEYPRLLMEPLHIRQDTGFLLQTLVLQLQEEVVFTEDVSHLQCLPLGSVVIAIEEPVLHLSRQTRGQSDDPFMVFPQQILVCPGLIVKPVAISLRYYFHQILIPRIVLCQQHQVPHVLVLLRVFVEQRPGRRIYLASNDRLYSLLQALLVKIYDAEHDSMVSYRQRIHSQLPGSCNDISYP